MLQTAARPQRTSLHSPAPETHPGLASTRRRRRLEAPTPTPDKARPFLKWVGGKRQLLPELSPRIPADYGTYHEPFVGGGALFFHARPHRAVLSDANERLIRTYRGVRDAVEEVIDLLSSYPHDRAFFLEMRGIDIDARSDAEVAAWFIYLNRTGFNGLYRVNRSNVYNVPFGDYTSPVICDAENLRACAEALRATTLRCESFEKVLDRARPGDFVYFDPPYVPLSASSNFTSYTRGGFGMTEHERLRDVAWKLKARGVHVLLSNSSAPEVHALYGERFELASVGAARAVNCKASGRGKVQELIIR
ncbi:DNA adenine methylase [Chondromyces apiculatus]|uniref:Site-specific DNA-methyltransferase (adenine-specific) n=1 Tax=Chondromyces apiculatus DSM 436 TaxID=1192034 RepID=A0A017SZ02_9BACT|nr:DNA adenine methylase [Chondromyces apiculatus]EYF02183.1 DNA adenine methylase [Chondromyces apiculatus DSM 436]